MTTTTNKRKTTNNKNNEDLTYRIKFSDPQREAAKQKTIQNQQTQQMKNLQKPTRTILIENLPDSHMDRYDFKSFFEVFGAVEQYSTFQSTVTLPHNDRIVTINCGAVRFESVEEAVAAVRALHGKFISGDSSIAGKNLGGKKGGSTEALIMSYVQGKQFPTGAPASSSKNVASQQQQQQQQQQQKTAPSSSSNKKSKNEDQQQQVNKQLSQQLVHMGFNKQQAEAALLAVSNSSVEDAVDYIESNFSTGRSASDSAQQEQQEDGGLTKEEKLQEKKRLKKERQRLQKLQQSPPQVESSNEKNEQEEKREEKTVLKEEKKNKTLTEPQQEKSASSSDENSDDMKNKVIQLVEKMKFQVSNDDFVKFRKLSADFQRGLIHANEYYRVFYKMFANDEESIFFLLLETMPNRDLRKVESLIVARHTFHDQQQQVQADKTSSNGDQDKKKKKKKKSSDQGSGATVTQNQAKTTGKSNVVVDKNNPFASLEDFDEDQAPSANKTAKKKSQKKKK